MTTPQLSWSHPVTQTEKKASPFINAKSHSISAYVCIPVTQEVGGSRGGAFFPELRTLGAVYSTWTFSWWMLAVFGKGYI